MTAWRLPEGGLPVPTPPLTHGWILLRHWSAGDAASLSAAWSDPEIARRLPVPDDPTEARAAAWIAGEAERRRLGLAVDLAVVDVDDRVFGEVGLSSFDPDRSVALVGWWTAPGQRGRGVASAAVRLVTDWALGELGLGALVAEVDRDNAASLRVADRAGYRPLPDRPEGRVALVATSADRRGAAGRAPAGGC